MLLHVQRYEDAVRVGVVGKNGTLTALMKELGALSAEEKKQAGVSLNAVKTEMEAVEKVIKDNIEKSFKTFSG